MRQSNRRLEAAIARNLAFWRGEQTDRPLVGVYLGGYEHDDIYLVARDGDRLRPQQLAPERFVDLFTALLIMLRMTRFVGNRFPAPAIDNDDLRILIMPSASERSMIVKLGA